MPVGKTKQPNPRRLWLFRVTNLKEIHDITRSAMLQHPYRRFRHSRLKRRLCPLEGYLSSISFTNRLSLLYRVYCLDLAQGMVEYKRTKRLNSIPEANLLFSSS
jgi:hypothetical protein